MANTAYKFRIYPTTEQTALLNQTFGCCRKVWNLMLSDKIAHYNNTGKNLVVTPAQYKTAYPFLKNIDSLALANVQLNLQTAYKNFFRNKKTGFPKYKSRKSARRSFTTNNVNSNIKLMDPYIKLPKLGMVKIQLHRDIPNDYILKSVTVSQDSDNKYYCSILLEYDMPAVNTMINVNNSIALDYTSKGLYTNSDGNTADMPKFYQASQKKLARAQHKLSRRSGSKKDSAKSANYMKQLAKVNKIYCKIKHQRQDFLQKKSTEIANQYDLVFVEDLDLLSIASSKSKYKLGKSTCDNGYGMFVRMLEYKLDRRGKKLIKVDKYYPSSQLCHICGHKNPDVKNLSVRSWQCPNCGTYHLDRDVNAAINIKNEGMKLYLAQ